MNRFFLPALVLPVTMFFSVSAWGQAAAPDKPMKPVEERDDLPRVLLIGDSISIGYTVPVRRMLADEANVIRPLTNCGPTTRGVQHIDEWLGEGKWDVIHFNWGLHDLKYIGSRGDGLVAVDSKGSHQQVAPEAYAANLERLVKRLKQTGASLIWCATTPVPKGAKGRVVGDSQKYNEIAAEIMQRHGIAINDLYTVALEKQDEIQLPANVHFRPAGSKYLAEQVVKEIRAALAAR
ncbi:SGNH/GDSL hydrolase family protein [Roseimaritima ulvae]|uniref:GDSL-like Lipase/Acylhydrolase n=1 Tax=Roseimaritima ulvae TaxID=980254 RepID=A0A5B9R9A5_9BACT|nr:SGNH/GDSL hydrolase family protein [Roseimaritima ulvae]QEG43373.1 GDSL-like Lipase/Acylhydrolase [Roseimaritima ulvae]